MVKYYSTVNGKISETSEVANGCWINMIEPTRAEVEDIIERLGVDEDFINAGLDEEESSRIEMEGEQTLIVVDVPVAQKEGQVANYFTIPLTIIMTGKNIITVCLKETPVIKEFSEGLAKNAEPKLMTQFVLTLLLKITGRYLQYLKQIDKISVFVEKQLHQSMRNKELIQLLQLEKSLVYFSTSLKANEVTFEKILRGRCIKLYEEDQDLLEDVIVEIKQAIEMANIYSSILSGTMDAFASIISNNLNIVMKVLASITILMAVPTIVSGFYGMNVEGLPVPYFWFPAAVSLVIAALVGFILHKKNML